MQSTDSFFKPPRTFPKRGVNGFPIGPRTKRRQKENRELNKLKIDRCEIRIPGICQDRYYLTWAHASKSRFLVTSDDWQRAARSCLSCHQHIEKMSHKDMRAVVVAAISQRRF